MKTINIGVAGLGTVGSATVRLLRSMNPAFKHSLGAEPRIAAVCDIHAERKSVLNLPHAVRRTRNWQDLIRDPSLDIIVETMGGISPARSLVLGALRSGKHVVTANKQLLAHHWDEIFRVSAQTHRCVRFEGSVAGGIPILRALDHGLSANQIQRVLGILNGTTNFILTRMAHDLSELGPALEQAQRLGLAEADPRLDLDGSDAAHKVAIIASLLTGQGIRPEAVSHAGILDIRSEDLRFAASELSRAVRLLGVVELDWASNPVRLTSYVSPVLVPLSHPLAGVHGEYNAVMVQASAAGDLLFYGKGAGAGPASSAVVSDILSTCRELLSNASPRAQRRPPRKIFLSPIGKTTASYYMRLRVKDRPGVLSRVTAVLARHGISISQIHQGRSPEARKRRAEVSVFITTHLARHDELQRALREILALSCVSKDHTCLRML